MSQLTQNPGAAGQGLYSSSATQFHAVGERMVCNDGREFRYCKMGAVAGVVGKLYQAPAEVTGDQNLTAVANSIGDTTAVFTTTVTVTANQYAGGWLLVSVTPDAGRMYKIKSHTAYTAAAPTFLLEDSIQAAWTTSTRCDLIANPYNAVVVNPTTATSIPVGAVVFILAISEFGWLQTKGVAAILNDVGSTVGTNVSASNAVAGAVEAAVTAQAACGFAVTGIANTEYGAIFLTLP